MTCFFRLMTPGRNRALSLGSAEKVPKVLIGMLPFDSFTRYLQ